MVFGHTVRRPQRVFVTVTGRKCSGSKAQESLRSLCPSLPIPNSVLKLIPNSILNRRVGAKVVHKHHQSAAPEAESGNEESKGNISLNDLQIGTQRASVRGLRQQQA